MINLEIPRKFSTLVAQSHQVAAEIFRPHSRTYDTLEHAYPKELDMLAAVIDGANQGGGVGGAGAGTVGGRGGSGGKGGSGGNGASGAAKEREGNRNGSNMATILGLTELAWGDVGLMLTMPRQGLGPKGAMLVFYRSADW